MESRNRQIYTKWRDIQDIIGQAKLYPKIIRRLFWTKNLSHFERFLLTVFAYVNGLEITILLEWGSLLGLWKHESAQHHVRDLTRRFSDGQYGKQYYAYNVTMGRYEYIDGTVRRYEHKSSRDQ